MSGLGQPIAEAKLRGLAEALERDHVVRFHNGSQVEYEDCERCEGRGEVLPPPEPSRDPEETVEKKPCPTCGGQKVRLLVTRASGGVSRYRLDTEIRSAYSMALHGPRPKEQPRGNGERFGEDAPW